MPAPGHPLAYIKDRLRKEGPKKWPKIAALTGRGVPLLKKIAYSDRKNPKLDTIMPLLEYFRRRDARANAKAKAKARAAE